MERKNYHITDEKIISHLLGEDTTSDRQDVADWIGKDPANKKYFDDLSFIWTKSKELSSSAAVDTEHAWERFLTRTKQVPVKRFMSSWVWKAASILFIAGLVVLYFSITQPVSMPEIISSSNSPVTDTLGDGSIVTLNKASRILYTPGKQRTVELSGEAFFNVFPDKKKPFILTVNDIIVEVTGTSFNVRQRGNETEVIVETGIVRVSKGTSIVELRSNEKVRIGAADSILTKTITKDALHNYYRSREFVCDNTPLWKLVEILNEAYATKIIIKNEAARTYPLTTTFENEDIDSILLIIGQTFKLTIERSGEFIYLK